jgi:hypothetical protein
MKTVIIYCVLISCSAFAGPTNLRNESNANKRKADVAISKDVDASVTYADIKNDLNQVGAAIDAIDLGSVTNTVFTGDQRTAVKNLKDCLSSLKVASKNLMQANAKLIKKMKETERIQKEARQ